MICRVVLLAAGLLLGFNSTAWSQMWQWVNYTDMRGVVSVSSTPSSVWAATSGGIFSFSLSTAAFERVTNVEGLSSIDATAILGVSDGSLVVGAADGSLDLRSPSGAWTAIRDIARATDKPRRGIRVLRLRGDSLYLGTDYGVSVFSRSREEFGDSYLKFSSFPSQTPVRDILFAFDRIWVATPRGVASARLSSVNLQAPDEWNAITSAQGLPGGEVLALGRFGDAILAGTTDGLGEFRNGVWSRIAPSLAGVAVLALLPGTQTMTIVTPFQIYTLAEDGSLTPVGDRLEAPRYPSGLVFTGGTRLADGRLCYASTAGVAIQEDGTRWTFRAPDGPLSNQFTSLSMSTDGTVWSASGRDDLGRGAYGFTGERWINYAKSSDTAFATNDVFVTAQGMDGSTWFGTWGYGVVKREVDGRLTRYSPFSVSGFPGIAKNPNFSPISGLAVDNRGFTWTLHYLSGNGNLLGALGADGRWRFYKNPTLSSELDVGRMAVDPLTTKWIIVNGPSFRGLLRFNDGGTLDRTEDDSWKTFDASGANGFNADRLTDLAIDAFGDLWIGTNVGVRTIYNPLANERVTRTCYNTRCNIEGQYVNCIAVDPVNNKWIGTSAGVFVLSSDGTVILHQFNRLNSQLLDNDVKSITIDPASGTVFMGTNKGLSSLRTPYARPLLGAGDLRISPQPFHPESDEVAMIDGLTAENILKIITVSGNLVRNLTTPGGKVAFWDGRDEDGALVPSGVYFVIASTAEGSNVSVGKIAVLRR